MDIKTEIEKHSKALRVLEAINDLNRRIASNERWVDKLSCEGFDVSHYENRIIIDNAIKERLTNYYQKTFKI